LEKCAFSSGCNSEYANKLDTVVSHGEENGVQSQTGEAEESGNQSANAAWLNKVENEGEKLMYELAFDWKLKSYPEEVGVCFRSRYGAQRKMDQLFGL